MIPMEHQQSTYYQRGGKNIIKFIKSKTKLPMNNASKNLKIFLKIEISFVCDTERPSCNVANGSVVLITPAVGIPCS